MAHERRQLKFETFYKMKTRGYVALVKYNSVFAECHDYENIKISYNHRNKLILINDSIDFKLMQNMARAHLAWYFFRDIKH